MTPAVKPMVVHQTPPVVMKAAAAAEAPASLLATEAFTKDAILAWYRGEFAAANAIIDALCGHLAEIHDGDTSEYKSAFAELHRRRMNWIPILQKQKFYPIADVERELRNVAEAKKMKREEEVENYSAGEVDLKDVIGRKAEDECLMGDDRSVESGEPQSDVTDSGSQEAQTIQENVNNICSNHDQCETRNAQIKIMKGFVAKEPVKGHMVNVVRGLKLYEDIFTKVELSKLNDFVNELRLAGQNSELSGETFILYNQQMKGNKRELIQLGVPIFRQIKEDSTNSNLSNIEPIPSLLQSVIAHFIQWRLIPENKKPNSCIINFFDEVEYSQPFIKPPHLEQPLSTLVLSESTMVFGRTLMGDGEGHYRGPLVMHLKEGSLLVMRGKSSDTARHAMCSSHNKRITITFFRVWTESEHNPSEVVVPMSKAMTIRNPNLPTQYTIPNNFNPVNVIPAWGLLQAPMVTLAPTHQVLMNPRTSGTGVFIPSNVRSRKHARHLPPRAQRGRRLALMSSLDARKAESLGSDLGTS